MTSALALSQLRHKHATAERERMIKRITAQMLKDGVDPERLTLEQAWGYFCFNPDWDRP
jgi:hypothetical protein